MELKIYNPQADGFLKAIDWNFEELKEEITKKSSDYLNLVYSDDQIKDAKQDRANLRKLVTALEDKRKEIKKEVILSGLVRHYKITSVLHQQQFRVTASMPNIPIMETNRNFTKMCMEN